MPINRTQIMDVCSFCQDSIDDIPIRPCHCVKTYHTSCINHLAHLDDRPLGLLRCDDCGVVPVPAKDLPVTLPEDVDFSAPGNPLANHHSWKHTKCPSCGREAIREQQLRISLLKQCNRTYSQ